MAAGLAIGLVAMAIVATAVLRPKASVRALTLSGKQPCYLVGFWQGPWRDEGIFQFGFQDNGRFTARPMRVGVAAVHVEGTWEVVGGRRIVLSRSDTRNLFPPESFDIEVVSDNGFTLIEEDLDRVRFTRLGTLQTPRCPD